MDKNIKRFPYSSERSRRLNVRKRVVPCKVSGRWLKFPKSTSIFSDGEYIVIDVMTTNIEDKDRKLCELVITREDLEAVLSACSESQVK